jgi:cell shape-determining protein MreC
MLLHSNNKKKKKFSAILVGFFTALFLASFFLGNGFPPSFVKQKLLFLIQPFINAEHKISKFIEPTRGLLKEKVKLENENLFLKQEVEKFKIQQSFADAILTENQELKEVCLREQNSNWLVAAVLWRGSYGRYNSLIIDIGSSGSITEGTAVTAYGNVLLGHITDLSTQTSRVQLISYPGKETNIFIGGRVSATAIGRGGGNLQVELPSGIDIKIGDPITTLGIHPLFLGTVEKIEKDDANPFQKIVFRLPINIQELRYVYLR